MNEFTRFLITSSLAVCTALAAAQPLRGGDHIAAVVNQELVTNGEIAQRMARVRADAQRSGARLPDDATLRRQVLDALIDERVMLTFARDSGQKVDEVELDRAVANVAAQNQLTMPQLRERLRQDGVDYARFRANLRDQILMERVREREVQNRIRITDAEIDAVVAQQRKSAGAAAELNLAQILVPVPEDASPAEVAARKARADQALARVKAGEDFAVVAREMSEDQNRERGGQLGMRPIDRLPDLFVGAVANVPVGGVIEAPLRSGAGFHVLKVVERKQGSGFSVTQTRARHILLRPSAQLTEAAAIARLGGFKRQVEGGTRSFEALARENSEDGSAPNGGDLGWVSPGALVPEFEQAMDALPIGGLSDPVVSRFGVHLIQVVERRKVDLDIKQVRDQARNMLREQKFEEAYDEWVRELRSRAYVEFREAPPSS